MACPSSHLGHHHLLHPNEHPHALERPDDGGLQEDTRVVRGLAHYKWHKAAPDRHHNPRIVRQHNGFPKKNHPENRSQLCLRFGIYLWGMPVQFASDATKFQREAAVSPKRCEQKFLRPEVVGCFLPARILPWSYDQLNLNALNFGFEWVKKNINRIKDVRPIKNGWSSLVKISKLSKHEQFYRPIGAPCLMFDTHLFQPAKS